MDSRIKSDFDYDSFDDVMTNVANNPIQFMREIIIKLKQGI